MSLTPTKISMCDPVKPSSSPKRNYSPLTFAQPKSPAQQEKLRSSLMTGPPVTVWSAVAAVNRASKGTDET